MVVLAVNATHLMNDNDISLLKEMQVPPENLVVAVNFWQVHAQHPEAQEECRSRIQEILKDTLRSRRRRLWSRWCTWTHMPPSDILWIAQKTSTQTLLLPLPTYGKGPLPCTSSFNGPVGRLPLSADRGHNRRMKSVKWRTEILAH
ncbi:unnamed protein product [Effrenium voratum]|nr:unnamed protein product [Effrenium voratum]